jgi:hypothetical protein
MERSGRAIRSTKDRRQLLDVTYQSKAERDYAAELIFKQKMGLIRSWRRQVRQSLVVNGQKITTYVIDFEVTEPDGEVRLIEVKGFATELWQLKHKLFMALNPDVSYTVVYV